MHRTEASGPGAAKEAQQERFRLIVPGMAECYDVSAQLRTGSFQERVTGGSSSVFDRPTAPPRQIPDIRAVDDERAVQRVSNFDAKRLVAVSVLAQFMIEVRQANQAALAQPIELIEQVRQGDRIGPARGRRHHGGCRVKQVVAPDRRANAIQ
jgi:hypothetical protein